MQHKKTMFINAPEVEKYLDNLDKWKKEISTLRQIIVDCGLTEDFKWMHPSYSDKNKNILLIHEFKDYCAILFNKGALLNDSANILVQQTKTRNQHVKSDLQVYQK